MKIYFEDGKLIGGVVPATDNNNRRIHWINACRGSNYSFNFAKYLQTAYVDNVSIYTNDIIVLLNAGELAWNGDTFEIYLRNAKGEWKLLKDLTNRELRQGHNIYRLWFAGEFEQKLNEIK